MSINWNYDEQDYLNGGFKPIEPGQYRVRIEKAEETTSKTSGKQMIKLQLKISGQAGSVWHYVVLDPDNKERTNKNLGDIFDSFAIMKGDFNLSHWEGKVGAAEIKQELYNDKMQAKVSFFIKRDKQDSLPMWQEKPVGNINADMMSFDDNNPSDVPF